MTCDIHVTSHPRYERSPESSTDTSNRSQERLAEPRAPERPAWLQEEAEYFTASDDESASTVSSTRRHAHARHVRQRRHTTAGDDATDTILLDSSGRPLTARDAETIRERENGRVRAYTSGQVHSTDVGSDTRSGGSDSHDPSAHRRLRSAVGRRRPSARFASQMRSISVSSGSGLGEGDIASSVPGSEGGDLASESARSEVAMPLSRRPFHARPRLGRHDTERNRTSRLIRSPGYLTGQQPQSSNPRSTSLDSAGTRVSFAGTFGRGRNSSGTSSVGAPMPPSAGLRHPPEWRPDTPSSRSCSDRSASNTPSQSDSLQRDGPHRPPR